MKKLDFEIKLIPKDCMDEKKEFTERYQLMTRNLAKFPEKLKIIQCGVSPRSVQTISDRKAKRNKVKKDAQNEEKKTYKIDDFDDIRGGEAEADDTKRDKKKKKKKDKKASKQVEIENAESAESDALFR